MVGLRILILNWRDLKNPTAGGAEVVVDSILKGLAAKGHKLTYFTSAFPGCKYEEQTKYGKIIRKGSMSTVYLHAFLYFLKHGRDFDFIVDSVSAVPFFTPLYFNSAKIIAIPHHIVGRVIFKELKFPKSLLAYIAERLIPLVYRNTNFIAVSDAVKLDLVNFGIRLKNITTCYFGVYSGFEPASAKKFKNPTLITVSRLMKYKRVDLLLDIFRDLIRTIDAELLIVGAGKELTNLKAYAKKLGVYDKVKFLGWVSEKKKAELLAKSWVFVTASEREGFGISALEAEMSGTPVVAFKVGGLAEAVRNNYSGFLVDFGNMQEFTNKVLLILTDSKLRNRFYKNSVEYSKRFDPKKAILKIDNIVRSNSDKRTS